MSEQGARPLLERDLPAAAELHAVSFPEEPWSAESLAALLAVPGTLGWVLPATGQVPHSSGPVEAFILVRFLGEDAEVLTLCVAPSLRCSGRASQLLSVALPALHALGAQRLLLEVAEDNLPARALYGRFAFITAGRRPGYYSRRREAPVDALLLARKLA